VLPNVRNRNPAAAVYGTVIAGSLIAAETADETALLPLSLAVVVTLVVYWAAHVYAELLAHRVRDGLQPTSPEVLALMRAELPLVASAAAPLLVILVTRLLGASDEQSVQIALWSVAVQLGGWALVAGRRTDLGGWELAGYVALGTLFGSLIVLLKWLLH
jgi:hypothetical protein